MAQLLFISQPGPESDLLALNLQTHFGLEVLARDSAETGIELLGLFPDVELVFCDAKIGKEKTAHLLANYLRDEDRSVQFYVFGDAKFLSYDATLLGAERSFEQIAGLLGEKSGLKPNTAINEELHEKIESGDDYVPIPLRFFVHLAQSPSDIFIRLRDDKDFKYVKRIPAKEDIDQQIVKNYQRNGLEFVYIPATELYDFTKEFSRQIGEKLSSNLKDEERVELSSQTYEFVQEHVLELGFDEQSMQLTQSLLSSIATNIKSNKRLIDYWKWMSERRANYRFARIQVTALVANAMIDSLDWGKEEHKEKLSFAALFHDMALADDEMLRVHSQKDLDASVFAGTEKKAIEQHALSASEALANIAEAPMGVDKIIREHHGAKNGVGFPLVPQQGLDGLSYVFCLAEDVALRILAVPSDETPSPELLLNELREKYSQSGGQCARVFQALTHCVSFL